MPKRILVVDNEPGIVRLMQVHLERAGFDVCGASNGQEALVKLAEASPIDLIITDVVMPKMDGFELLEAVRQQPAFLLLPVIVMCAQPNDRTFEEALQGWHRRFDPSSPTNFGFKPCNPAQIIWMARAILGEKEPH